MDSITQVATHSAITAWAFVGNFLALLVLTIVLFLFALKSGRAAFIALVVSLYAGFALYSVFPYTEALTKGAGSPAAHSVISILIFGACSVVVYIVVRRIATSGFMHIHPIMLVILSFITAGFLLALGYHFFAIGKVLPLSATLDTYFAPSKYFFYWFIAPLVALFLFAR